MSENICKSKLKLHRNGLHGVLSCEKPDGHDGMHGGSGIVWDDGAVSRCELKDCEIISVVVREHSSPLPGERVIIPTTRQSIIGSELDELENDAARGAALLKMVASCREGNL